MIHEIFDVDTLYDARFASRFNVNTIVVGERVIIRVVFVVILIKDRFRLNLLLLPSLRR